MHARDTGNADGEPVVFLHGWPESSRTWDDLIALAGNDIRAISIDLPGIGDSLGDATDGTKADIADAVHDLVTGLGVTRPVLVGHDIGGMVVYAYLRRHPDVERAVIMNVPIPGVAPWDRFVREPYLWHFALHTVPDLPERLVSGRQRSYFDYFYDALTVEPDSIDDSARAAYAQAYAEDSALTAGFDWYRAFSRDVEHNQRASHGPTVTTPVLYLRGAEERGGDIDDYAEGLRKAGIEHVEPDLITGARHFPQHEAPAATWRRIAEFLS